MNKQSLKLTARAEPVNLPSLAGYLQFDVHHGDIDKNRRTLIRLLAHLAPPPGSIVVLPELWATGFAYDQLSELAARTPELLAGLAEEAEHYGIILAGSLLEQDPANHIFYNTLFITGPAGEHGSYRKQRLFSPMNEDRYFTAGNVPRAVQTPLGLLAGLVCFDLRFPELVRSQAAQGAVLLVVSAQWPRVRLHHWRTLLRARAIENQLFVVACNRCGSTNETKFGGHSMIIAPDGTVLSEAEEGEESGIIPLDAEIMSGLRNYCNTAGPAPYPYAESKISSPAELASLVRFQKIVDRQIVFTSGCFETLNPGHVNYLEQARRLGDCLIIGLNSDSSLESLDKGEERHINNQAARARLVAALGCVDHVVIFEEETPLKLIKTLRPDILVKRGDWPVEKIVGGPEVMAAGGQVISLPLVDDLKIEPKNSEEI